MNVTGPGDLECLLLVAHDSTKSLNAPSRGSDIRAGEIGEDSVIAEPKTPV